MQILETYYSSINTQITMYVFYSRKRASLQSSTNSGIVIMHANKAIKAWLGNWI